MAFAQPRTQGICSWGAKYPGYEVGLCLGEHLTLLAHFWWADLVVGTLVPDAPSPSFLKGLIQMLWYITSQGGLIVFLIKIKWNLSEHIFIVHTFLFQYTRELIELKPVAEINYIQ